MWLRIDERTDVLASLSLCASSVKGISKDPALWKWCILALHNGLQGAMVCHLSGTAQIGALSTQCAESWLKWHDRDARGEIQRIKNGVDEFGIPRERIKKKADFPPKDHLAKPEVLFERLHDGIKRHESGCGAIIDITSAEQISFDQLNAFRNDFTHFTPKGWSIETTGLPNIALDIIGVIEKISVDPWSFRHMEKNDFRRLSLVIKELRQELGNLNV